MQVTWSPVNVTPPTGLGEPIHIPNVNTESENYSETLRGSHVRSQELGLQKIPVIPQVDGPTSIPSRNWRVIPENVRIGWIYPEWRNLSSGNFYIK